MTAHGNPPPDLQQPRGTPVNIDTQEIDRAEMLGGAVYHPHKVELLEPSTSFAMNLKASTISDFTVGLLQYATPVTIHATNPRPNFYQVNFPLFGAIRISNGSRHFALTNKLAMVQDWTTPTILSGWHEPALVLGLRIPLTLVEHTAAILHDEQPDRMIHFEPKFDLNSVPGSEWKSLATALAAANMESESALNNPLVATPLIDTIVRILLTTQTARSKITATDNAATGPRTVQQAMEFMRTHANTSLSLTTIAAAVNASTRSLQLGFHRYADAPPMTVLRRIRLEEARKMLQSTPHDIPIRDVAAAWGFNNPGRFAVQFAQYFGASPSEIPRQ